MLLEVSVMPGLSAVSASGMGTVWGPPRPMANSAGLMAARTEGRRCKGGVSGVGEGRRSSSSCVALRRKKVT